jgi:hypothetical protein
VADIFRRDGESWRQAHAGHISLGQLKVMSAIETCRTDVLGGHVLHCEKCDEDRIAYNSCRNRHCPKCQGLKAEQWLEDRQAELLPVEYYHVVFTLPAQIADIAYQNKAVVYDLLFKVSAQTLFTIAGDPNTWGSALTHHPHIHCIVPGGGLDGETWVSCKRGFFLSVRVLSQLFRRLFLERLYQVHRDGQLRFFGELAHLANDAAFRQYLAPLAKTDWFVYAKQPFAGPQAVLAYLSRYTHRVAISNHRLIANDERGVTFQWKDYRTKHCVRYKSMTLRTDEFIRRFLIHVLPKGFHRIRHYGLFANPVRRDNLTRLRQVLPTTLNATCEPDVETPATSSPTFVCRTCGTPLQIAEILSPKMRSPP